MKTSVCTLAIVLLFVMPAFGVPAFPGAEGFGSQTAGGRYGDVLVVDSLADSGTGTLRAALDASGCRIVLFEIGGTIVLESSLVIDDGCITIAGQTALGDGIEIMINETGSAGADSFPALVIDAPDIVIRHLKIRPGLPENDAQCDVLDPPGCSEHPEHPVCQANPVPCRSTNDIDGIAIDSQAERVVLDHVSVSWATDELVSIIGATDVTIQWSIVAEGIDFNRYKADNSSTDGKGLMAGNGYIAETEDTARISLHHNVFSNNTIRNPQLTSYCRTAPVSAAERVDCAVDIRNNVSYNWYDMGTLTTNSLGHHYANVVGNFFKQGPDSHSSWTKALSMRDWAADGKIANAEYHLYEDDNVIWTASGTSTLPTTCYERISGAMQACDIEDYYPTPNEPFGVPAVSTSSAASAYGDVLGAAGARLVRASSGAFVEYVDNNDERILDDVANDSGAIIDEMSIDAVDSVVYAWGGLPTATGPPPDSDMDGMPDGWEGDHCLDDLVANDSADTDGDVYTDLEEYLNGTLPNDDDADGVESHQDNCRELPNASQIESDPTPDGFGDMCDCDLDADGGCGTADALYFYWCANNWSGNETLCAPADMDSDGDVDVDDESLHAAAASDGLPGPGAASCN